MLGFITNSYMLIIFVIMYIITAILSIDLAYWEQKQEYLHWKKVQSFKKHVKEKWKWNKFRINNNIKSEITLSLIPMLNIFYYILIIVINMQMRFTFSNKYILEDICSWKKGINAFLWQIWKPSNKWEQKYPIN